MDDAPELLDTVVAVSTEDPVCLGCTGRLVADRSFGLSNVERGSALRIFHALSTDSPYEPPDPDACWVCEGHTDRVDEWADRVVDALAGIDFDTYQIGTRAPALLEENDRLLRESIGLDEDAGEPLKRELNREVGKRVGERTGGVADLERPDVVALLHLERGTVEVSINPAFVYGRYQKRERDIPQTEWPCRECGGSGKQLGESATEDCDGCAGTGYRYDRSVEGLVAPHVAEAMQGEEAVFHGAGREDVDARMLGTGRPFVIEVKRPRRRQPDLDQLSDRVNEHADGAVVVSDLAFATHEMVERVKELAASKTYRVSVRFDEPVDEADFEAALDALEGVTVEQYTPQRVNHRRASLTRERTVYAIEGTLDSPTEASIELHGEGGLYVKELIHGDEGRTDPSLAGLLSVTASVESLDVVAVEGEEERFARPEFIVESSETETDSSPA